MLRPSIKCQRLNLRTVQSTQDRHCLGLLRDYRDGKLAGNSIAFLVKLKQFSPSFVIGFVQVSGVLPPSSNW